MNSTFVVRRNNIGINNAFDNKHKLLPEPCHWHLCCFVADSIGSGFLFTSKISEK